MQSAPFPTNEAARIEALRRYEILDTAVDEGVDDLTRLAARLCGTPIALVSLIDTHRQWFKSRFGTDATETPRDLAFCAHAILQPDRAFVVEDAHADSRFFDNPLVTGGPLVRAYLGVPLVAPGGEAIGTLCVIDHVVRAFSADELETIRVLGRQVVSQFELQKSCRDLAIAVRSADAATRAKSSFLATMSHEIRTPMNGVVGMIELARANEVDDVTRGYLDVAQSSAGYLLDIINDILDLSKIEADKLELEAVPFSLEEVVHATLRGLGPRAEEKGLRLVTDLGGALPKRVLGDPVRVRQILTNLVGNALKFTARGAVTVTVGAPSAGRISLAVTDTGIGIPLERQASIFEAFTQAESATTRQFGGTGLGLTICRRLSALMGGTIAVESEPGEGTTFVCDLALPAAEPLVEAPQSYVAERFSQRRLRVLVADDNSTNRLVAQRMLEKLGHAVVTVDDGRQALAAIESDAAFDLVLMDVQMPEMDGLEAARHIRELEAAGARPRLTIVALTASAMKSDVEACAAAGMDDYMSKPFRIETLREVLARTSGAPVIERAASA